MKRIILLTIFASILFVIESCAQTQQKVNIKTFFHMLPDNIFPNYIPLDDKQGMESHISVCDYKNGYLELGGGQFVWEMCYWNLKDGRKLLAVNYGTEEGSIIRTFFYEKGKLLEDKNYKLGGEQSYVLEDFIDVSQLNSATIIKAEEAFANGEYSLYYGLPRKGTSLKVWIDRYSLLEEPDAIPYEAQKEVTLKWINEKWVKQ